MRTGHFIITLLSILIFSGCDLFEAHPYDAKIEGNKDLTKTYINIIEQKLKDKDTIRFAFISDTQRWYDETEEVVKHINAIGNVDFVIHGGDISDFGVTHEFELQRDILMGFHMPWVVLLGNHDCLGTGEYVYRKIFGHSNFYFQAGNTLFICLNTNALEYDYSEPVPDFGFLESLITNLPEGVERTVVAMHVPPFDDVFNNNVAKVFQLYIKTFPNLIFCLNGHRHSLVIDDLFDDGILYYQTPNIKKRQYILFTLFKEGYEYEVIDF